MRRIVRYTMMILVLVGITYGVYTLITRSTAEQEVVMIQDEAVVELGDLTVTVNAIGTVLPARQVPLLFELAAPVNEVLVEEGQIVRAGDVLARLDLGDLSVILQNAEIAYELQQIAYNALTTPPREEDIAVAQAALNAARAAAGAAYQTDPNAAEIARLQAEIARNQLWQTQLQRDQTLTPRPSASIDISPLIPDRVDVPPDVIDDINARLNEVFPLPSAPPLNQSQIVQIQAGVEQSEYGVQIAEANLQRALNAGPDLAALSAASAQIVMAEERLNRLLNGPSETELQMAQIELERARLAVEQARANIKRAELVAPFDGVVAQNNLVVGELPPSQSPALLLIDASAFYVDLSIDETDIVDVQVGQPVSLAFDALPGAAITGSITRVAQTPTPVGQVVTYLARVTLDPTNEPIRVGMNVTATIVVKELQNVLTLRNRFVHIDRTTQEAFVTVQRGERQFEEVRVVLGLRNETDSQIISGLEAGQRIVLLPRESLIPGIR